MDIKGIIKNNFPDSSQPEEEREKKRKRLLLLFILLLILVAISSCGVGALLNKYISKDNIGGVIDLSPDNKASAQYLMLSGNLVYKDGSSATGMAMEFHSTPKYTTSDGNGFFSFLGVETGKHVISVLDEDGNVIASKDVEISTTEGADTSINLNDDGSYLIELSTAVQLLEIEIEIDKDGKTLTINQKKFDTVDYDGTYKNPSEEANFTLKAGSGQYIVTPTNTVVLPGGIIILPGGRNGSTNPQVIMSDGTIADDETLSQTGLERLLNGSIQLPGEAISTINGEIILPSGNIAQPGTAGILIDSEKLKSENDDSSKIIKNKENSTKSISTADKKTNKKSSKKTTTKKKSTSKKNNNSSGSDNSGGNNNQNKNNNPGGNDSPIVEDNPGGNDNPGTEDNLGGEDNTGGNDDPGVIDNPGEEEPSEPVKKKRKAGDLAISSLKGSQYVSWTQNSNIDIFHTENEEEELTIAPGSEGIFNFQLNNTRSNDINITVKITEPENGKHLPLLFDLKDKSENVVSDAVCLNNGEELIMSFKINRNSLETYALHWEWPYNGSDDAYDTLMGNLGGQYILNVEIYAEEDI